MRTLATLALALLLSSPAKAQEIKTGIGLLCDTKEQAEAYARDIRPDRNAVLSEINGDQNPPACGIFPVVYVRVENVGRVVTVQGTYDIAHILVLGFPIPYGVRMVSPTPQFTLFEVEANDA